VRNCNTKLLRGHRVTSILNQKRRMDSIQISKSRSHISTIKAKRCLTMEKEEAPTTIIVEDFIKSSPEDQSENFKRTPMSN
jgi:hypothetical protein